MRDLLSFGLSGVVSAGTMRVVDKNADGCGISTLQRMVSAGFALASAVRAEHVDLVLLLCGTDNNGGDGFCAARHLANEMQVTVFCAGDPKTSEARREFAALGTCPVEILVGSAPDMSGAEVIVDALLGTSARLPLNEPYLSLVSALNTADARVITCVVPTFEACADRIIAFHLAKTAGAEVYSIGIPLAAELFCGEGDLLLIPDKPARSHKGFGGTVLVICGGPYQGAPFLDRLSGSHVAAEHRDHLIRLAEHADAVVCGPGLGTVLENLLVAGDVVAAARRTVVDADLICHPLPTAREATIYTPHAGEFSRVFGAVPKSLLWTEALTAARACMRRRLAQGTH